ncbi:hypothetical protein ACQRCQ_09030 [Lachnospiraceae bacterium SGI.085]
MWAAWKEMFAFLQGYYNNGIILYIYVVSFATIMLLGGRYLRKCIGWPTLVIMIVVFNPVFYRYVWLKCFNYGYWRVFWLFPVGFVISAAAIVWLEKIKQRKKQAVFLLAALVILGCNGKNMFSKQLFYSDTKNLYKLPQEAIDVADTLLELDTEPRVVMCSDLYSYVRQYSTDIKMMYGRNAEGYIDGRNEVSVVMSANFEKAKDADWTWIAEMMRMNQYKYLVIPEFYNCPHEYVEQYSFVLLKQVDGYSIFEVL